MIYKTLVKKAKEWATGTNKKNPFEVSLLILVLIVLI
jgi:hypothetical protein